MDPAGGCFVSERVPCVGDREFLARDEWERAGRMAATGGISCRNGGTTESAFA